MSDFNLIDILGSLSLRYLPFLFALCFHEFAHAYVAKLKGDNTAELMGRLSMNPFVHADLWGTCILPILGVLAGVGGMNGGAGFIFGWAKPVPVNERNLSRPVKDMFWIALAGPLSNILLATVCMFIYVITEATGQGSSLASSIATMAISFVMINVLLAVFNMIPCYPLDGAKVMARFLPLSWNQFLEDNQMVLNIVLIGFFILNGFALLRGPIFFIVHQLQAFAAAIVGLFL